MKTPWDELVPNFSKVISSEFSTDVNIRKGAINFSYQSKFPKERWKETRKIDICKIPSLSKADLPFQWILIQITNIVLARLV